MAVAQSSSDNINAKTVELVKLLTEIGPDVPEISRRLGQFKESVRYRYKEKILGKGFAVQASVDHEKLGLQRLTMKLDFADDYREYAPSILASMNELCFLVNFSRTMPGGFYLAEFSVPRTFVEGVREFFEVMKEKGMFSMVEVFDFDWFRLAPMKAEYYDFGSGRWDFDWSGEAIGDFDSARYMPSTKTKFDQLDLLIIKELQVDANTSLKEMADKLKVNYKKLAWHYGTHVVGRRLLRGYTVNWMGTRYDYAIDKALHRQHRYVGIQLLLKDPSEREMVGARQRLSRIPYLWAEAGGKDYAAQVFLPVDSIVEGFQFFTDFLARMKDKSQICMLDQTDAVRFTIPYKLFDSSTRQWAFNASDLQRRFDELLVQIKRGTV